MIEEAAALVDRALSESGHYTPEMDRAAVARSISVLNSYGVTAFLDAASMESILAALKGLDDAGILTAWSVGAMPAYQRVVHVRQGGGRVVRLRDQFRSAHVRPDFLKLFLDGVPAPRTAAFHDPYVPDAAHGCCFRGSTTLTVPDLVRWVALGEKLGLSSKIHCAGDAAVSQALDAIDVVRSFNGPTRLLHHIAHASYIRPTTSSASPNSESSPICRLHLVSDGDPGGAQSGARRRAGAAVLAEPRPAGGGRAGGCGVGLAGDSQSRSLERRRRIGHPTNPWGEYPGESLWPEQAVDLTAAIEIYTINGARAIGLGSVDRLDRSGKIRRHHRSRSQLVRESPHDPPSGQGSFTAYFQGRPVYERE